MQAAALKSGKTLPYSDYALLGDDIVLTDKIVCDHYKSLIHDIGAKLSETKTHSSQNGCFEFAKRWFLQGDEITGAPLRSFLTKEKYSFMTDRIFDVGQRWFPRLDCKLTVDFLFSFYKLFHSPKFAKL